MQRNTCGSIELWEYDFGFSSLHIVVSGNIHNLNTWSSKAFLGSDFLRVVSSDRRTQVLTVLDQRCESVDLSKKNILTHVSATLCAISLYTCM